MVNQSSLIKSYSYDATTGKFTHNYGAKKGQEAGTVNVNGYVLMSVKKTKAKSSGSENHAAHRLAFLYMTGVMPKKSAHVDHINGNRSDNRWENLRVVTCSQNILGFRQPSKTLSGVRGVCWNKKTKAWMASHTILGVKRYLGLFNSIDDAEKALTASRLGLPAPSKTRLHYVRKQDVLLDTRTIHRPELLWNPRSPSQRLDKNVELTESYAKKILSYDPDTGIFYRIIKLKDGSAIIKQLSPCQISKPAVSISGKTYQFKALAYLLVAGKWPKLPIGFKDGDLKNFSWRNLYEVNAKETAAARPLSHNNLSGEKGVGYHKASGKWRATTFKRGKHINIGYYASMEEAVLGRRSYVEKLYTDTPAIQ